MHVMHFPGIGFDISHSLQLAPVRTVQPLVHREQPTYGDIRVAATPKAFFAHDHTFLNLPIPYRCYHLQLSGPEGQSAGYPLRTSDIVYSMVWRQRGRQRSDIPKTNSRNAHKTPKPKSLRIFPRPSVSRPKGFPQGVKESSTMMPVMCPVSDTTVLWIG